MKDTLVGHVSEDILERYAMGKLSAADCAPIEEHILICPTCQRELEAVDDYIRIARAAIAALAPQPPARIDVGRAWVLKVAAAISMMAGTALAVPASGCV